MGHLDRQVGFLADPDDLLDGFPEETVLAADVADVGATVGGRHAGKFHHFFSGREGTGVVLEPGRESQRAGLQFLAEQIRHLLHLLGRRLALVVVSHDLGSQRPVTGVGRDVDSDGRGLEVAEQHRQRVPLASVLTDDDGCDALADRSQRFRNSEQLVVVVTVDIDEAGRQDQTVRVDDSVVR